MEVASVSLEKSRTEKIEKSTAWGSLVLQDIEDELKLSINLRQDLWQEKNILMKEITSLIQKKSLKNNKSLKKLKDDCAQCKDIKKNAKAILKEVFSFDSV